MTDQTLKALLVALPILPRLVIIVINLPRRRP
jgi:hypothetical protein